MTTTMTMTTKIKLLLSTIMGVLTSLFGALAIPIILLISCNIIDYITGITASIYNNIMISSYKSFKGIVRKITMWLLIVVGVIVDKLLTYCVVTIGFTISLQYTVSSVVAIWLIVNELISICENINDIGLTIPLIQPILNKIKSELRGE